MVLGIIIGVLLFIGIISVISKTVKKVLEVISLFAKFGVGVVVSSGIYQALPINIESGVWKTVIILGGGIIIASLIIGLCATFRLVGYSVNYLIDSVLLLMFFDIVGDKISLNFVQHVLILFVFPRIMWISDRFSTTSEYSHSEHDVWNNTTTNFYNVRDVDWWNGSDGSWNWIPVQIVIATIFYTAGSSMLAQTVGKESLLLFLLIAAVNIVFDIFVFRKIEEFIDNR